MSERLLTVKEAADLLRLEGATISVHIASGALSSLNIGDVSRIRASDIQRFLGGNEEAIAYGAQGSGLPPR